MQELRADSVLVIPFYNESKRIRKDDLVEFVIQSKCDALFVDDGSSDFTLAHLQDIVMKCKNMQEKYQSKNKFSILSLNRNFGKTNAVRQALLQSSSQYRFALITDSDLPYLLDDCVRALETLKATNSDLVSGARIALSGNQVKRNQFRHWIGRIIATFIHFTMVKNFYDPQSPCKAYNLDKISDFLVKKFNSRWFGDIELILRIEKTRQVAITEFPLTFWRDRKGGNLKWNQGPSVIIDLLKILVLKFFNKNLNSIE